MYKFKSLNDYVRTQPNRFIVFVFICFNLLFFFGGTALSASGDYYSLFIGNAYSVFRRFGFFCSIYLVILGIYLGVLRLFIYMDL